MLDRFPPIEHMFQYVKAQYGVERTFRQRICGGLLDERCCEVRAGGLPANVIEMRRRQIDEGHVMAAAEKIQAMGADSTVVIEDYGAGLEKRLNKPDQPEPRRADQFIKIEVVIVEIRKGRRIDGRQLMPSFQLVLQVIVMTLQQFRSEEHTSELQ